MALTQDEIGKILGVKKKLAQQLLIAIKDENPDINDIMFVGNTLIFARGNREVAKEVIANSSGQRMAERCALLDFVDRKMHEIGIDGTHGVEDAHNELYMAYSMIGFAVNTLIFQ